MSDRLKLPKVAPDGYKAAVGLDQYVSANVEHVLLLLIQLRASVLNGCAFCVDFHSRDLVKAGEGLQRIMAVTAWRESPFFSEKERAALALTDAITHISKEGVTDEVWSQAQAVFSEKEMADLILAIGTINLFTRIGVSTHLQPARVKEQGAAASSPGASH